MEIAQEAAAEREETGRSVLGARAIQGMDPHYRPDSCARSPAPLVHCSDKSTRECFRATYREFVGAFRDAMRLLGEVMGCSTDQPLFPPGAFPLVEFLADLADHDLCAFIGAHATV